MKDLCQKHNIKTAAYRKFSKLDEALEFLKGQRTPIVVKADGLAAGKGVIVAQTIDEAKEAATDMLSGNRFGEAGHSIIIEEFLDGEELSFFAICDGKTAIPFSSAQDHKRAFDGDKGPNTGGMGAYAPARLMTPDLENKVMSAMIQPTLDGMAADGCPFIGVLFAGLMVVKDNIYLLEYNIRFGDPECQALMKLFDGDLLDVLYAASQGSLDVSKKQIFWRRGVAMCVVMAANGYPAEYQIGSVIGNLNPAEQSGDVKIFHAGTNQNPDGRIVSTGGRVLGVTGFGDTIKAARKASYDALEIIDWPEGFYRSDIGHRAL
jgi:phosphoribosylamine--glycine ligase